MISYCIACLRPRYSRALIAELVRKTSVPYEILVWLNLEDPEFVQFLHRVVAAGHPLRIVGTTPHNIGMAGFFHLFEASRFEMVAQMDDDVVCISPRIAETAADVFNRFPNVGMLAADVWQDEYTNGARPPMNCYRTISADYGLYDGPIDGWFAIYRKCWLQVCRQLRPQRYMNLGGQIKVALARIGKQSFLCTRMRVFHIVGPEYVSYFDMLDFEISKYRGLGRTDMVKWYSEARSNLPARQDLESRVKVIQSSLSTMP